MTKLWVTVGPPAHFCMLHRYTAPMPSRSTVVAERGYGER